MARVTPARVICVARTRDVTEVSVLRWVESTIATEDLCRATTAHPLRRTQMLRHRDPKIQSLSTIAVLSGLSLRALREVSALTTEITLPAGHVLCQEGELGREVFLLVEGTVAVRKGSEAVGVVQPGGVLGEMAVLELQPRVATLVALTDVTIQVLNRGEFASLLARYPSVSTAVRTVVDTRVEQNALSVA